MRLLVLSALLCVSMPCLPSSARADEAPARLRVLLPADATLTIDGAPTHSTSGVREFITPPLTSGKYYHYELQARFVRGGNEVTVTRRLTVRAGQETAADLNAGQAAATTFGAAGASENQAFYYAPGPAPTYAPFRSAGPLVPYDPADPPVRGFVGGARDNWKPDFSDPFIISGNW